MASFSRPRHDSWAVRGRTVGLSGLSSTVLTANGNDGDVCFNSCSKYILSVFFGAKLLVRIPEVGYTIYSSIGIQS